MPPPLANQRVTVMGLGHFGGGIAVAKWLIGQGAKVLVTDQASREKLEDSLEQLTGLPIEYRLGEHRVDDFTSADLIVASPAVPLTNQYLAGARTAGIPITTEIRLFIERCPSRNVLAVTGTKGKSTTTAMLAAILKRRFPTNTWVGGNLGKSLLEDLPRIGADDPVVLELSSFMLEHLRAAKWSPHVAVVTMVARDHVEWHGSIEAYIAAKRLIIESQTPADFAILNQACPASREFARHTRAQVKWFGGDEQSAFDLTLAGAHNQFNAQAAFSAASCLGCTLQDARPALAGFHALPHRLELVHEAHGIRYYNDSIATIPEAAVAALEAFPPRTVIQIVGGRLKDHPIQAMCNALAARAKAIFCIGEKGPEIAAGIARSPAAHPAPATLCEDLAAAVKQAKRLAAPGDIILLSTGCKSYDRFANFEERGELFTKLVRGD